MHDFFIQKQYKQKTILNYMPFKPTKQKILLALLTFPLIPQISFMTDCPTRGESCKDYLSLDFTYKNIYGATSKFIKYHNWDQALLLLLYILTAAIAAYIISSIIIHLIQKRKKKFFWKKKK